MEAELRRVCFMYHCSINSRKQTGEKARLSGQEVQNKEGRRRERKGIHEDAEADRHLQR